MPGEITGSVRAADQTRSTDPGTSRKLPGGGDMSTAEQQYQSSQLITYIGSKRRLLPEIEREVIAVQKKLGQHRTVNVDLFSGSGCVARMLKRHSSLLVANDLEKYAEVLNSTFLRNWTEFNRVLYEKERHELEALLGAGYRSPGIITEHYAPADTQHIQKGERAFYTHENALRIDTVRAYIDTIADEDTARSMLAMLLVEASIHVNTSGVFKGFYKDRATGIGRFGGAAGDALDRIMGSITIGAPRLSTALCETHVLCMDAKQVLPQLGTEADITYIDPPYNQHPYGSNYFLLNLLVENKMPEKLSAVSGIPADWNRSAYNSRPRIRQEFCELLASLHSKYAILSYNNEGFLSLDEICELIVAHYGTVLSVRGIDYNAFRGSRNLHGRPIHTKEYLIVAKSRT